jgi:hypothetical protein
LTGVLDEKSNIKNIFNRRKVYLVGKSKRSKLSGDPEQVENYYKVTHYQGMEKTNDFDIK